MCSINKKNLKSTIEHRAFKVRKETLTKNNRLGLGTIVLWELTVMYRQLFMLINFFINPFLFIL